MKPCFSIIIPISIKPNPDKYEVAVAQILAEKFQSDILFVERSGTKTPDIQIVKTKQFWEIKNIKGDGKLTIEDNLRKASRQSDNVAISLLRSKMTVERATSCIQWFMKHAHANIKRIILVTKDHRAIDFYPQER